MSEIYKKVFPGWMQEFKRFQTLKSQFYLYGNVYDCYYFPVNYHTAKDTQDLKWARFNDLKLLLKLYLKNEGYEIISYYDVIDGIDVESPVNPDIDRDNIVKYLIENVPGAKFFLDSKKISNIEKKLTDALSFYRLMVSNNKMLSAGIINYSSRFSGDPNNLSDDERVIFLKLLKSAQDARLFPEKKGMRNILIFICDKLNDIPSWLLLENPLTKGIDIKKPNKEERNRFMEVQMQRFYQKDETVNEKEVMGMFADLTDGFVNQELENLITISNQEKIHINNIQQVVDLFKYGTRENFWEDLEKEKIENAEGELRKRVMGQDAAIAKSVEIIRRAKLGLHSIDMKRTKTKPKGVMFFAGPTGVGKTELAKSLASLIFNDEDAILRFDMSEYNDSNSDTKLIGSPPGYVGYEEGGQLTSQVSAKPFSIVLFDEIEKAHPVIFDKFLQILDDGRLTDGKGETVYFSESLIIFTSNLGVYTEDEHGQRVLNVNYEDSNELTAKNILDEIRNFFNTKLNRPEILNRFGDNFVVFNFIRSDVDKQILLKSLDMIKENLKKQKNCIFDFDDSFIQEFRKLYIADNLINGGRGINNRVETHIKNGIANFMYSQQKADNLHFRVFIDKSDHNKVKFECIGS